MKVIRSHDGVMFEFSLEHMEDVDGLSAFQNVLGPILGVEPHNMILMYSGGTQLTDYLIREFLNFNRSSATASSNSNSNPIPSSSKALIQNQKSSTPDNFLQPLYAFDRQYLSANPSEISEALAFDPHDALEAEIPPFVPGEVDSRSISSLALAYQNSGSVHFRTTIALLSHIRAQKASLEVALRNLDSCRESQEGALVTFQTFAQPLMHDYGLLLEAFRPSYALAKMVKIHSHLLSNNLISRSNSTSTSASNSNNMIRAEFVGDYVWEDRMLPIRDRCARVFEDFRTRFERIRVGSAEAKQGSILLRNELSSPDCDLDDLQELERDSEEGFNRTEEITALILNVLNEDPNTLSELFSEQKILDEDSRERIVFLIERKNFWLQHLLGALNRISYLQSINPNIGSEVHALDMDLKNRTDSFKYLARLKDFVIAYASTVVEVVRRREYAQHLSDYASALASSLSKLANDERKRRIIYHNDFAWKRPFPVKSLDDTNVPTLEFSLRNKNSDTKGAVKLKEADSGSQSASMDLPPLTRADVDELINFFRNVEQGKVDTDEDDADLVRKPAREVRLLIEKQFLRLENMESAFSQALEKIVVSGSQQRETVLLADKEELAILKAKVDDLTAEKDRLDKKIKLDQSRFSEVAHNLQLEIQLQEKKAEELKLELLNVKREALSEKETSSSAKVSFEIECENLSCTIEKMQDKISGLEEDLKIRNKSLQESERQLTSARATADDATRELHDLEARHRDHISDHQLILNQLQEARDQFSEVERDLFSIQEECQNVNSQLEEKNQLLKKHIIETNEVRQKKNQEIGDLNTSLAEERKKNEALNVKVNELESLISEMKLQAKKKVEQQSRLKEESDVITSRLEHHCLLATRAAQNYMQTCNSIKLKIEKMPKPGSSHKNAAITTVENSTSQSDDKNRVKEAGELSFAEVDLPPPSSIEFGVFLESLWKPDSALLVDTVEKKLENLSQYVRKWMKESKGYGDRAKRAQELAQIRITFRDFAKGDLALFLPTRNPTPQVWAAFNVSFPHYFLQTNEVVAPIIKSREWLVARIVALTEKVVESMFLRKVLAGNFHAQEPENNPYQLPAEVEPWSAEKTSRKTSHSMAEQSRSKRHTPSKSTSSPMAITQKESPADKRRSLIGSSAPSAATQSSPETVAISEPNKSALDVALARSLSAASSSANPVFDLSQSEFTVIDSPPSAQTVEAASDSPFRTTLEDPSILNTVHPSGLTLSLNGYNKPPMGICSPGCVNESSCWKAPAIKNSMVQSEVESEFRPSEPARPAFLAGASLCSSRSQRTSHSPALPSPLRPRLRPIPRPQNATRQSSRTSSFTSSANMKPALKALLDPGSPLSKGSTTVSTTFVCTENDILSSSQMRDNDTQLGQSSTLNKLVPFPQAKPIGQANESPRQRISLPGQGGAAGASPGFDENSQRSGSSPGGSGSHVRDHGKSSGVTSRMDRPISRSSSLNASQHTANNSGNVSGVGGNSISNLFSGSWRRRRDSLILPGSFGGASDLLKRFSSQN
ncbi:hypothetical protein BY996DRAFT_6430376 [Phakopsora pachyrhizi]|nr:hypothetical protein BY996DRAFT_6430376 [Phakopsora pachyrhizi]